MGPPVDVCRRSPTAGRTDAPPARLYGVGADTLSNPKVRPGLRYNACGTTAVTSISTLARASISALTSTALIATS